MDQKIVNPILGGLLAAIGATFYFTHRFYSQKNQQYKDFKQSPLGTLSDLSSMKQGQSRHIKVKIKDSSMDGNISLKIKKQIGSNQYYFEEPSDVGLIREVEKLQKNMQIFPTHAFTFVDSTGKEKRLLGVHSILGDVYSISKTYSQHEIGFFKKIWKGFVYVFEYAIDLARKQRYRNPALEELPHDRKPFFSGPVIGMLRYSVGLLTNTYFVVKVQFNNGVHSAEILAESKNHLLGHYKTELNFINALRIVSGLSCAYLAYRLFKSVRKWMKDNSALRVIRLGGYQQLRVDDVKQDKSCIICYSNCRNLVMLDCMHLIMCRRCAQELKEEACPICKKPINHTAIVYRNKADQVEPIQQERIGNM